MRSRSRSVARYTRGSPHVFGLRTDVTDTQYACADVVQFGSHDRETAKNNDVVKEETNEQFTPGIHCRLPRPQQQRPASAFRVPP